MLSFTTKDILKLLPSFETNQTETKDDEDEEECISAGCVTLVCEGEVNTWYLATCIEEGDTYKMEFLHRVDKNSNLTWKHPSKPDIATLQPESILQCVIDGDWDLSKRNVTFTLKNHTFVNSVVMDCA